ALTAQRLGGTEDATFAFWSHDSRFIGFYSGGKLKKIEATGGPAQPLCDAPQGSSGGAWNAEGVIIFHPRFSDALYRVSAAGGAPAPPAPPDASPKKVAHAYPQFLPARPPS